MIVQCDKCQTKFRIADEKVRPNGVKVRCSRCAHVFVVRREDPSRAVTTQANLSGEGRDPFESRTVPTIPDASSLVSGLPTARAPIPPAATASSLEAAAALGFSGLPAPPKKAALPPLDSLRGLGGPSGLGETFRSYTGSEALTVRSAHDEPSDDGMDFPFDIDDAFEPPADPLAPLASLPPTRPPAADTDVHRRKTTKAGLPSFPESKPNNAATSLERFPPPLDDDAVGGATEMNLPGLDGPSSSPSNDPFPPPPGLSGSGNFPRAEFGTGADADFGTDADFDFGSVDFGGNGPGLTGSGSFPPPPGMSGSGAFPPPAAFPSDPLSASGGFPAPDFAVPKPSRSNIPTPAQGNRASAFAGDGPASTGAFPPPVDFGPHAAPATAEELGDIPGLMDADPFGGVDADPAASLGAYSAFHVGADDTGAASGSSAPHPGVTGEAIARLDLGRAGVQPGGLTHHEPTAIARAYQPPGARKKTSVYLADGADALGWWPTAVGVAAGFVVAALFVPGVAEHVGPLIGAAPHPAISVTSEEAVVPGSLDEVVAESTYVRKYRTRAGRELLVIGGSAASSAAVGRVDAVVAVLDEGRVIERRTAPVGAILDEATLHDAQSESYLSNAFAAQSPQNLSADDRQPFMVVFWAPPTDAEQKTYRVAFVKSGASARAEK